MTKIYHQLLLLLCCFLLIACSEREQFSFSPLKYADLLRVHREEGWTGVEVLDAWHPGQVLHRYLLVPRGQEVPANLPEGTLVRTPLRRVVPFSSVHGGLFCDLGCADQMVGLCDINYVQLDSLKSRLADGRLADMGSSMKIDQERMVALRPDALFVSPFENSGYGVLSTLGIPLIECADYMETSPLGRAEWMKFYGMLMGREATADSLFSIVESDYLSVCQKVENVEKRPSLLCDFKQGTAWYVPGGQSYLGKLFVDAGADYLYASNQESGSAALSFENVYQKGREADIWLVKYGRSLPHTYESVADDNPLYTQFKPWKTHRMYGCNTFAVPYYEEVPFHPNRLLRDLICIFHSDSLPGHTPKYYFPLSE